MSARPASALAAAAARYPVVALVLQGGGALGAYQAGVIEGLAEAGLEPNRVAGISIGALNAAIFAGNPPERRVERLRAFWETICRPPVLPPSPASAIPAAVEGWLRAFDPAMVAINAGEAWRALVEGQNGFFVPRLPPPWAVPRPGPEAASWYDTTPLRATLERFADFDRINAPGGLRVQVGAVDVETGNFRYFDSHDPKDAPLGPEHFMASGALPPGFPAVPVQGRWYWDGGLVSNTPLETVLDCAPRHDALVFQVDLWSASGALPRDLFEVANRTKDIQFSSRTRYVTDRLDADVDRAKLLRELIALVPAAQRGHPAVKHAERLADDRRVNVLHLIYDDRDTEGHFKDYQFGPLSMRDHWATGLKDLRDTLAQPGWLAKPADGERPFVTHDIQRVRRAAAARRTKKKPEPEGSG